jgi:hypothetical protein
MRLRLRLGISVLLAASASCSDDLPPSAAPSAGVARGAIPTPVACGGAGLPDCPLQQWMKATLQTYQREADFGRLARALDELQVRAPAGYAHWSERASGAASAARKRDAAGVRAACKHCHDEHRAQYRRERRNAAWP